MYIHIGFNIYLPNNSNGFAEPKLTAFLVSKFSFQYSSGWANNANINFSSEHLLQFHFSTLINLHFIRNFRKCSTRKRSPKMGWDMQWVLIDRCMCNMHNFITVDIRPILTAKSKLNLRNYLWTEAMAFCASIHVVAVGWMLHVSQSAKKCVCVCVNVYLLFIIFGTFSTEQWTCAIVSLVCVRVWNTSADIELWMLSIYMRLATATQHAQNIKTKIQFSNASDYPEMTQPPHIRILKAETFGEICLFNPSILSHRRRYLFRHT